MDWFFGCISTSFDYIKLGNCHKYTKHIIKEKNLYLAYGDECVSFISQDNHSDSFVASGCGIVENSKPRIAAAKDWQLFLQNNDTVKMIGHYACFSWQNNLFKLFNDRLGQRTIYYVNIDNRFYFSTQLDWLFPFVPDLKIDFINMSAYWLLIDPITDGVSVNRIKKLPPNSLLTIKDNQTKLNSSVWIPDLVDTPQPLEQLSKYTLFPLDNGKSLSLGLSGGLDSRTLLAILTKHQMPFSVYTFGHKNLFDYNIAKKIATDLKLDFTLYNTATDFSNRDIDQIESFIHETQGIINLINYRDFSHFNEIESNIMIDGGKGEYFRRGLARKLEIKGPKMFANKELDNIGNFLSLPKADIFNQTINKTMKTSINNHIEKMINEMPSLNEYAWGTWIDLYNIRYRTPNGGAPSQARLDNQITNYMPFIQIPVLDHVLSTSVNKRTDGKLCKKIIKTNNKKLLKYDLARYGTTIPFTINRYSEFLLTRINLKKGKKELNIHSDIFDFLKEYILDRIISQDFKESPIYNQKKIISKVDEYYNKGLKDINYLSWWLTFDIWNRKISK